MDNEKLKDFIMNLVIDYDEEVLDIDEVTDALAQATIDYHNGTLTNHAGQSIKPA